jgi:acetyltransferase-like isoleucine patch superfamily enzyme
MNVDHLIQRLMGRATCELAQGSRLSRSARVRNISGDTKKISVGKHCHIQGELLVFGHGGQITIGDWCYVGEGTRIWSAASIVLGNRVLISHSVNIFDNLTHPIKASERHDQVVQILTRGHPRELALGEQPVTIHDDAWIGAGAFVLRGVTVGEGAIVAAGIVLRELSPDER